ncbi:hypothetical protein ADICYQ_4661 [Cyclobacterium qasimii M12-11B]|uniref:Uncharacterized protein n=2 Tax=Cyclobacterium qasimii TaxID=1350429 RepID=S7WHW2_9BACT|nr:hypothetical protein ADICYQ_4661 [Cyclobacterium qasimii M12-11B]GEO20737.1 hypothetical protein CQA01_12710 [Cyclobacterium qasimii]
MVYTQVKQFLLGYSKGILFKIKEVKIHLVFGPIIISFISKRDKIKNSLDKRYKNAF